jgi:hypothetical protein
VYQRVYQRVLQRVYQRVHQRVCSLAQQLERAGDTVGAARHFRRAAVLLLPRSATSADPGPDPSAGGAGAGAGAGADTAVDAAERTRRFEAFYEAGHALLQVSNEGAAAGALVLLQSSKRTTPRLHQCRRAAGTNVYEPAPTTSRQPATATTED